VFKSAWLASVTTPRLGTFDLTLNFLDWWKFQGCWVTTALYPSTCWVWCPFNGHVS